LVEMAVPADERRAHNKLITPQRIVAGLMATYVRLKFRPRLFGLANLHVEPSTILAVNHRSDSDVPLLVTTLARPWRSLVERGLPWPTFAADDHAFFRGFLAGYPSGLPLALRRLLWPIRVGRILERRLQCVPVGQPDRMFLVELLRDDPTQPLGDRHLPAEVDAALRERASRLGRQAPEIAADVLRGAFADLLWTELREDETPNWETAWRNHARYALKDFRRLADALRAGGVVVIFPEGELAPDGRLGPLQPGFASLARRAKVRVVQPIAIAYDPLGVGRPRAYVSIAPMIEPRPGTLITEVAAAWRRAIPLTAGQLAALVVLQGGTAADLHRVATAWIGRARAAVRPIEPALLGPGRRAVLVEALWRARRYGPAHPAVVNLAQELRSTSDST
jgi:1-acyl-sn-glycerol-3-phosphate acyltransferase